MTDFEAQLRAELRRRAETSAGGPLLAERIIVAARTQPRAAARRGWPTWSMPLLAAGAVAAIVTGVFVGVDQIRHSAAPSAPPLNSVLPTVSHAPVTGAPSLTLPVQPAPTTERASASPSMDRTSTQGLHGVHLLDLSFVSDDYGYALASADCVSGSGTCTALLRTTDGATWTSISGAAFNVPGVRGCADPCVRHVRYATADIGYAYGPDAFFVTADGGRNWSRQPGGASELETLNGIVLRIRTDTGSCTACGSLELSSVGGSSWRPIALPGVTGGAVPLVHVGFAGRVAFVVADLYPTQSDLFVSDDGATWTDAGKLCQKDPISVAGAADGAIAVDCASHEGGSLFVPDYLAISDDGGRTFGPARTITPPGGYADAIAAASSSIALVARDGTLRRTVDAGRTWQTAVPNGPVEFLGFESDRVGRVVTDATTIWTTRDAGATWTAVHFG